MFDLVVFGFWGATCGLIAGLLDGSTLQIALAIWTLLFSTVLFRSIFQTTTGSSFDDRLSTLMANLVLFHLALLGAVWLAGRHQMFWVTDSVNLHLPGVEGVVAAWKGEVPLRFDSLFGQFQFTHAWVALWFAVLGKSPVVSALALLTLRAGTWAVTYFMARDLFGSRVAVATVLLAAFVPTQIYYSMVFYKDPLVQLLVMVALYGAIRAYRSNDLVGIALGLSACLMLFLERIYLGPMVGLSVFVGAFFALDPKSRRLRRGVICAIGLVAVAVFYVVFDRDFNIDDIPGNFALIRRGFGTYSDVDIAMNFDIPYVVALVKTLFTPFFSIRKFEMFTDLSALLTWGSFVGQFVTLAAFLGIARRAKSEKMELLILLFPLGVFLLVFAYLAPFSGRQRDSFFPIIAMYAAYEISVFLSARYAAAKPVDRS